MIITGTGSIAQQNSFYNNAVDQPMVFGIFPRVVTAATLGSMSAIFRWQDAVAGAQVETITFLLTAIKAYKGESLACFMAANTWLTVECSAVGLIGSTSFSIGVAYGALTDF